MDGDKAKIKLANDAEYDCISFALASVGYLYIRVEMSLSDAAKLFSDTEKLERIEFHPSAEGEPVCIVGFTQLDYIVNEGDCVRVALTRPVQFEEVQSGEA